MTDNFNIKNNVLINYTGTNSSITIPNGVEEIASQAIVMNKNLIEITFSPTVNKINTKAIMFCPALTTITIPEFVSKIEINPFFKCPNLNSIIFENKYTKIEDNTFSDEDFKRLCKSFYPEQLSLVSKKIILVEVLKHYFDNTESNWREAWKEDFYNNKKELLPILVNDKEAVFIASYVGFIDKQDILELKDIVTKEKNYSGISIIDNLLAGNYDAIKKTLKKQIHNNIFNEPKAPNNNIFINNNYKLYLTLNNNNTYEIIDYDSDTTSIFIPNMIHGHKVSSIGSATFAFYNPFTDRQKKCIIEDIEIDDGITEIKKYCFCDCKKLKKIKLPKTLKTISSTLFGNCENLIDIHIPENVSKIEEQAFFCCQKLEELELPKKLKFIGDSAFYRCTNLKKITFNTQPQNVTPIEIEKMAFSFCKSLESIEIPNGVKTINTETFLFCTNLKEVILPKTVEKLGSKVFEKCPNIRNFKFENKKLIINENVFEKVVLKRLIKNFSPSNLSSEAKKIVIINVAKIINDKKEPSKAWKAEWIKYLKNRKKSYYDKILDNKEMLQVMLTENLLTLPEVKELAELATEKSNIEASVALINYQKQNFSLDDLLKEREKSLVVDVTSISYLKKIWAFKVLEDKTICITNYKGRETKIEVPSYLGKYKVTALGKNVFTPDDGHLSQSEKNFRKTIKSIKIPDGITSIGPNAFIDCESLTELRLPEGLTEISSSNKIDYSNYHKGFLYNTKIENITIPSSVKKICKFSFYLCHSLKHITFQEGLETIESAAFAMLNNLEELTFPQSLKSIEMYTFQKCVKLKKVEFLSPSKLSKIDYPIFLLNKNLEEIILPEGLKSFSFDFEFSCCNNIRTISLPETITTLDLKNFKSKSLLFIVKKDSYAEDYVKNNNLKYKSY